jgi:dTDP-4-amino-4,6-dideoxygalactose transaminase
MVPRFSPNYGWRELFTAMLPSSTKNIEKLKQAFIARTGHDHAYLFNYGRSGLFFLLKSIGAMGKNVVVSSYTCVVVTHAIECAGYKVKLADIDHPDSPICNNNLLAAIDQDTVMVIVTNLYGITVESKELYKAIKKINPNIFVLQDMAHSFFCQDSAGNVISKWGDGALFGMNISKLVNSVKGGVLTLRNNRYVGLIDEALSKEMKPSDLKRDLCLSFYYRFYVLATLFLFTPLMYSLLYFLQRKTSLLNKHTSYYDEHTIELPHDYNVPMSPFQAAIGRLSMASYDKRVKMRQMIAETYYSALEQTELLVVSNSRQIQNGYTWSHFPILLPEESRDGLSAELESTCGVEIGKIIDYSIDELSSYQNKYNFHCMNSRSFSRRVVNLPLCYVEGVQPLRDWKPKAKKIMDYIRQSHSVD